MGATIDHLMNVRLEVEMIWLEFHQRYEEWELAENKGDKERLLAELMHLQRSAYAKAAEAMGD